MTIQQAAEARYPEDSGVQRSFQSVCQRAFIAGAEWALEQAAQKADSEAIKHNNAAHGAADLEWGKAMRAHWALQDLAAAIRSLSTTTEEEK